ncbi:MAG TPA: hypothetical protein VFL12_10865, partial [Thermoanaerobaculia bacterium]|nr:hypothetical protein [Thermoanaerobaculia bacterium]
MKRLLFTVVLLGAAAALRADVHFGLVEDSDDHHYYRSSGLTSFEVRYEGEIDLSPDRERVTAMAPEAWIEIRSRRLFSSRMVRVSAGPDGKPQMHYWRADRPGS